MRIDWHLTNRCNFYCDYCHPQIKRALNNGIEEPSPAQVSAAFDGLGQECEILMSGGEPFAYPDFANLCALLTVRHKIRINTNLSLTEPIRQFVGVVDPAMVLEITAAFHVEERNRLGLGFEEFAGNYRYVREAGFNISALYVMFPPLISRARGDFERLQALGVDELKAKVFKGAFQGVRYPDGYSIAERQTIFELSGSYPNNEDYILGEMSFKGRACSAGVASIKVNVDGAVQRCATIRLPMGNLFDGSVQLSKMNMPCTANRVLALSECKELVEHSSSVRVDFK